MVRTCQVNFKPITDIFHSYDDINGKLCDCGQQTENKRVNLRDLLSRSNIKLKYMYPFVPILNDTMRRFPQNNTFNLVL